MELKDLFLKNIKIMIEPKDKKALLKKFKVHQTLYNVLKLYIVILVATIIFEFTIGVGYGLTEELGMLLIRLNLSVILLLNIPIVLMYGWFKADKERFSKENPNWVKYNN